MSRDLCPHCGADLQGEPIPVEYRQHYGAITHYSRKIGLYSRELDRTTDWQCPDCGGTWPRLKGKSGFRTSDLRVKS